MQIQPSPVYYSSPCGSLMLFLIAATVLALLGGMGALLYRQKLSQITPDMTAYEIQQSLGPLSGSKDTLLLLAAFLCGIAVLGLLCLKFISPWIHASLRRQLAARKSKVVFQYTGALLVSAIMLFPICWMIISALKTSDALLRPVPTLWPMDCQWLTNIAAVLNRAPFGLYFFNTIVFAYFIFMLRQTFMSVDNSYLEAGKVDGMGRIGSIVYVLCPMCQPTLITVGIIPFINGWSSYFGPKMVTAKDTRRTIAVGVNHLRSTFARVEVANYHEIMTGAVLAILPIVVPFLFLQKYIMTGMSKAAMKQPRAQGGGMPLS